MFERDYLMNLLLQFFLAITRSMRRATEARDPRSAAETLEAAIGEAVDIDAATLLSLSPESIASVMQVSGADPQLMGYVSRSLQLESRYLRDAGEDSLACLRGEQAHALAEAYGIELDDAAVDGLLAEALQAEADAEGSSGSSGISEPSDAILA